MSKDKRDELIDELEPYFVPSFYSSRRKQASAALDIALKAAAGEVQRLSDKWYNEWRAGHKANTHLEGKFDGADECAAAILALTSEGVSR